MTTDPDRDDPRIEMLGRAAHAIVVRPLDAHRVVEVARSRRRRTLTAGLGALAVAVIATGTVLAATGDSRATSQRPDAADATGPDAGNSLPAPPTGTKWVGQNGVAVAVPTDWAVTEHPCGVEAVAFVFDGTSEPTVDCVGVGGQLATVRFDPIRDGAKGSALACDEAFPGFCTESRVFNDGSKAAHLTVRAYGEDATEVVQRVLDSVIAVPGGWTTVPFDWGAKVRDRLDALSAAGLEVEVIDRDRINPYEVNLSPQGGTVVPAGTAVALAPIDYPALDLTCPRDVQVGLDLDIPGPGRPTPAEAAAPYSAAGLALTTKVGAGQEGSGRQAEVLAVDTGGVVQRVYAVTERDDGWWPDSYSQCPVVAPANDGSSAAGDVSTPVQGAPDLTHAATALVLASVEDPYTPVPVISVTEDTEGGSLLVAAPRQLVAETGQRALEERFAARAGVPVQVISSDTPKGRGALQPGNENLAEGQTAPLFVYAHCGLRYTQIDGRMWETPAMGNGSAPPGFSNDFAVGSVTRLEADLALFHHPSLAGPVEFKPAVVDPNHVCF